MQGLLQSPQVVRGVRVVALVKFQEDRGLRINCLLKTQFAGECGIARQLSIDRAIDREPDRRGIQPNSAPGSTLCRRSNGAFGGHCPRKMAITAARGVATLIWQIRGGKT